MSTRCQVLVIGDDINGGGKFTLYHHCDGYPSYMLPTIAKGWANIWQSERVGKAASMIIGADPIGFELESSNSIHGDIEYYYIVEVHSRNWKIKVYETPFDCKTVNDMNPLGTFSIKEAIAYSE